MNYSSSWASCPFELHGTIGKKLGTYHYFTVINNYLHVSKIVEMFIDQGKRKHKSTMATPHLPRLFVTSSTFNNESPSDLASSPSNLHTTGKLLYVASQSYRLPWFLQFGRFSDFETDHYTSGKNLKVRN